MIKIKIVSFAFVTALLLSLFSFAVTAPEIFGETSIRTQEPLGLRVKAVINAETASYKNTLEYGFLVSRKVFLTANGLTDNDLTFGCGVHFDKGVAKGTVNGESVDKFFDKNDTELYFAGHFYGISPKYYTDIIVARPYIISVDGVSYGEPVEMSIYEAAKNIYCNKDVFDLLPEEQQKALFSVIVAVEGEPYEIDRNDFRIVVSTTVKKNVNPTYSVYYDLYNPFNGEYLYGVKGRKSSKNYDEIASMLLERASVVPVYDGVVQDTTEGYVSGNLAEFSTVWIGGYDSGKLSLSSYDNTLKCKDCVKEHVSENSVSVYAGTDTPVSVFDGNFEKMEFSVSSMDKVLHNDLALLCHNGELYCDYIKAYVSADEEGMCEYIIVTVNDGENSALDEKCPIHSSYSVDFYVDGTLFDSQSVLYNSTAVLPVPPEKDGYTFKGWSMTENGNVADIESVLITQNTSFYAVFERIPVYYTVTFISNGTEFSSQQVLEDTHPNIPEPPVLDGYEFIGWSECENGAVVSPENIPVNADTEYYAVFERIPVYYAVTYKVNGEVFTIQQVLEGTHPNIPDPPVLDGYEFIGWSECENGAVVSPENIPVNADAEYFAVFEKLIVYYDVTFIFDGEVLAQNEVLSGDTASEPQTPDTKDGCKFFGWSLSDDNNTNALVDVSVFEIQGDTVFYSVIITNPNSDEFMEKLTRGHTQLKSIKRATGLTKEVLKLLTDCIGYVLEDANDFIYVDKVHVGLTYADTVARAKQIVNEEMSSSEKSQFVNLITSTVDKDVQDFLYEYFDINTTI